MLSKFCIKPADLGVAPNIPTDIGVSMLTKGSQRLLTLQSPWIIRKSNLVRTATQWPEACGHFRNLGVPVFAKLDEMSDVPAVAVPSRFAARSDGEPLSADEVESADAFELRLRPPQGEKFALPMELAEANQLSGLVEATRVAAGSSTPVGMELPVGVGEKSLETCLAAEPDFISLVNYDSLKLTLEEQQRLLIDSIGCFQHVVQSVATPCVLMADVELDSCDDAVRLLAMGVQQVSIDSLLLPVVQQKPTEDTAVGGMLANLGVATSNTPKSLDAIAELLHKLNQTLIRFMSFSGSRNLNDFGKLWSHGRLSS